MTISLGIKVERTARLLVGLRSPRIAKALEAYGFTDKQRQEGWELLQAVGKTRFDTVPAPLDMRTIRALDDWENVWFPIADATLARHYPASHARLFLNLSQTEGPKVAITVHTFLTRYDAMKNGEGAYGPEGPRAAEVLANRGLTAEVIATARNLLATLAQVAGPEEPAKIEELKAELRRAEDALWAWFLEWSQVARIAIKQRALLRQLGFLGDRGGAKHDEQPADPAPPPSPVGNGTLPPANSPSDPRATN